MMALIASLLALQDAPERSAPFTGVRWDGEIPVVRLDGEWLPLVSLDGLPREKLVGFCKTEYGDRWKKRFSEDLVEVLKKLGHSPKLTVELEVGKDGATAKRTAAMTEANRRAARTFNDGEPAEPAEKAPALPRPPREARPLFEFASARIAFKYGGAFEGTETYWVAEQGKVLVLQREKKVGGWDRKTTFVKDGKATTFDPETKSAFSSALRPADVDLSVAHATDEGLKAVGLLRKGTEDVAGRPCVLYENIKGDSAWRSWRWKGIELKIEMRNINGLSYVKEATAVEEGVAIPPELLKVPDGYATK